MKFTIIATALALASTALSAPANGCMTKKQAQAVVDRYVGIQTQTGSDFGDAQTTAEKLLVKNYQEISDSILSLERLPLGGPATTSRQDFIDLVLSRPPGAVIETLGVYVAGCNKILWQWNRSNVGTSQYEVKGFHLITVNRKLQMVKSEFEFNNVAWGLDTFQLPCPTSTSSDAPEGSTAPDSQQSSAPPPPGPSAKV